MALVVPLFCGTLLVPEACLAAVLGPARLTGDLLVLLLLSATLDKSHRISGICRIRLHATVSVPENHTAAVSKKTVSAS